MEFSSKSHFKDNQPIAIKVSLKYQISRAEKAVHKAADLFAGKPKTEVTDTINYRLKNKIEKVIYQHLASEFDVNPTALKYPATFQVVLAKPVPVIRIVPFP